MNDLNERVTRVETIVKNHDELLKSQIVKNESLLRLTILMEKQEERDEKQNEQMERITNTLKDMNENLSSLNSAQHDMQKDVNEIGKRVEVVEKEQKEMKDSNTISLVGLSKKTILWIVGVGLTALSFAIYKYLNLK